MPDARDQQLLDRLNALRPTPVTLDATKPSFGSRAANTTDTSNLTSRFARLQTTSPPQSQTQSAVVYDDDTRDTEVNEEDELSLDALLADLQDERENSDTKFERSDVNKAQDLMRQARAALGEAQVESDGRRDIEEQAGTETQEEAETQQTEEDEVDEYIQQALAAAELDESEDETSKDDAEDDGTKGAHEVDEEEKEEEEDGDNAHPTFSLPSAPTSLPSTPAAQVPSGTLQLPSTPTSAPRTTPTTRTTASSLMPTKPTHETFTDEEIATWCVICNEDATVKCLGCEGDLYCGECWAEGHTGSDAGHEERRHRAVRYVRDKKVGKVKARRRLVGAA